MGIMAGTGLGDHIAQRDPLFRTEDSVTPAAAEQSRLVIGFTPSHDADSVWRTPAPDGEPEY